MSRRRRRGNKLLGRILLISVIIHLIAVPILAKYGAFEKISRHFMTATVTVAPPPPLPKEKPVERKTENKRQVAKAKGTTHAAKSAQAKSNAPHPPVVVSSAGPGDGADNGPAIEANGTGRVGQVPTGPSHAGPATNPGSGTGTTVAQAQPKPEPKSEVMSEPKPEVKAESKPVVLAHVAVFLAAEPTYQPMPVVPDDLRADALDKTCVVDIAVAPDGTAASVKVDTSSGSDELDDIAVRTARKWRFKPATRDGEAIGGRVRLHVEFKVE